MLSYDAHSLILDGRRLWLCGGSVHYSRVPRALWRERIRAARQAGLNCIQTSSIWAEHERKPGRYDFDQQTDLRGFLQICAEEGMWCVLRPGPYLGCGLDLGGIPAWLNAVEGVRHRQANGPFLEACARYLGQVMEQVRDLQASTPGGGPLLMVQIENEWYCHNEEQGEKYLHELVRYLRENGCTVPVTVSNNLWQRVEGTIDTWHALDYLTPDVRQLHVVQPHTPAFVAEFSASEPCVWNEPTPEPMPPELLVHRLVEILAGSGQFNVHPFHGGTNFGTLAGRGLDGPAAFHTTSWHPNAPLSEAGARTPRYAAVKRVAMFTRYFEHVLSSIRPNEVSAAVAPRDPEHPVSLVHLRGDAGQVIYALRGAETDPQSLDVMLPDGQVVPLEFGDDLAAWMLTDVQLGGIAELTYTNLRAWAMIGGKMLVLFGPPGALGLIAIDGAQLVVSVPNDNEPPVVESHEGLTLVVLNLNQVDAAYVQGDQALWIGVNGFDADDQPMGLRGWPGAERIDPSGGRQTHELSQRRRPPAPKLQGWRTWTPGALIDGSDGAYRQIDGPASLERLDPQSSYGWYRLTFDETWPTSRVWCQGLSGHRLHMFQNGKPHALLGVGPGANPDIVKLGAQSPLVVLADNLGRHEAGWQFGRTAGMSDHLYGVREIEIPQPTDEPCVPEDPVPQAGFLLGERSGPRQRSRRLTWKLKLNSRDRGSIGFLDVLDCPGPVSIAFNDHFVGHYDRDRSGQHARFRLDGDCAMTGGQNTVSLTFLDPVDADVVDLDWSQRLRFHVASSILSENASWAFAPFAPPDAEHFEKLPRAQALASDPTGGLGPGPRWYRLDFMVSNTDFPMWLIPEGLSKGVMFLNGRHLGRYFVATADGEAVPGQSRYYLPEVWLTREEQNRLLIFDEHGHHPEKVSLIYDHRGPDD